MCMSIPPYLGVMTVKHHTSVYIVSDIHHLSGPKSVFMIIRYPLYLWLFISLCYTKVESIYIRPLECLFIDI